MSARELPARPHLDHLKGEAKTLHKAWQADDPVASGRLGGSRGAITLTPVRAIARDLAARAITSVLVDRTQSGRSDA